MADHCTVCHKCLKPCPVNIDFGDVSMDDARSAASDGPEALQSGTAASMFFLNATNPQTIKVARTAMLEWRLQGAAHGEPRAAKSWPKAQTARAACDDGQGAGQASRSSTSSTRRCRAACRRRRARVVGYRGRGTTCPSFAIQARDLERSEAVFYFPGCGSERLFSQVGLATQAMLWKVGVQTVLPPGYLCCGYPQRGAGQFDKAEKIITDNRVLFHRVANTLNYLDIKTVVVSCGTCYDQLQGYKFDEIFPGCRIIDIHEFLMERNVKLEGVTGVRYMYHDPCHYADEELGPAEGR